MGVEALRVCVVYIIGAGRSGSTVLDTVLGNHQAIESVGELCNLLSSGWMNGEYCACGERGNVCAFWQAVKEAWVKRVGIEPIGEYMLLQKTFERVLAWPILVKERRWPSARFRAYAEYTRALFEALGEVTGKAVIIDSSKRPSRAFALSLILGMDVRLIHLVRDGRGVAWSLHKAYQKDEKAGIQREMKPRAFWRTAIFWSLINLYAGWVRRQGDPATSLWVRYEDFVANPTETLERIGVLTGLDFAKVQQAIRHEETLSVGHTIAGNRMRMLGQVRLRFDGEWIQLMPEAEKRAFWRLAGWLLKQYNYSRRP